MRVGIPQTSTNQGAATFDPAVLCTATAPASSATTGSCYAAGNGLTGITPTTTSGLHTAILNALKAFSNANPYLNNGYTVSYPDTKGASTGLVKVFYYVTNGTPSADEQDWINFMTSPNAQPYFNINGYFSFYQYAAA